jgi:hypothetical protein
MAREEYTENPRHLLRSALLNASGRLQVHALNLETEAQHLRSDAQRLGRLAELYGTTPRRRLLARRIPPEEATRRAQENGPALSREDRLTG